MRLHQAPSATRGPLRVPHGAAAHARRLTGRSGGCAALTIPGSGCPAGKQQRAGSRRTQTLCRQQPCRPAACQPPAGSAASRRQAQRGARLAAAVRAVALDLARTGTATGPGCRAAWSSRSHQCRTGLLAARAAAAAAVPLPAMRLGSQQWRWLGVGVALAILLQFTLQWASNLPIWQRVVQRFIWWRQGGPVGGRPPPSAMGAPLAPPSCWQSCRHIHDGVHGTAWAAHSATWEANWPACPLGAGCSSASSMHGV